MSRGPLHGRRVVVSASGVAAAYAGRLLSVLGAETILLEPPGGSALRSEPPWLDDDSRVSALFAYLAAGARSTVCDLDSEQGRTAAFALLSQADILVDDTPLVWRSRRGLDEAAIAERCPHLVHVSVLPFGASGPKADWVGEEINLLHASGEGNLLPNGLSVETFPDRPPVKIHGHFAELQGGVTAALGALSALWVADEVGGQFVDVSVQDAALAVSAFSIQRLGDGQVEHRKARSFRYGGVLPCADGFVELLTLEQRQWEGLVELLGRPEWAADPRLSDPLERSRRGAEINRHVRAWARSRRTDDVVAQGQAAGVPIAKYMSPADVLGDKHERVRGLFAPVDVPGVGVLDLLTAPFRYGSEPFAVSAGPPSLGEDGWAEADAPAAGAARMQG